MCVNGACLGFWRFVDVTSSHNEVTWRISQWHSAQGKGGRSMRQCMVGSFQRGAVHLRLGISTSFGQKVLWATDNDWHSYNPSSSDRQLFLSC